MSNEKDSSGDGIARRLLELWQALLQSLEIRMDLFLLELKEEKKKAFTLAALVLIAMVLLVFAFILLHAAIIAYFWDSHRHLVTFGLAGSYLVMAVLLLSIARMKAMQLREPFRATRQTLRDDFPSTEAEDEAE